MLSADHCPPIRQLDVGVFVGPAPDDEADLLRLRNLGVGRVLDLRTFRTRVIAKQRAWLRGMGLACEHLPIGFSGLGHAGSGFVKDPSSRCWSTIAML